MVSRRINVNFHATLKACHHGSVNYQFPPCQQNGFPSLSFAADPCANNSGFQPDRRFPHPNSHAPQGHLIQRSGAALFLLKHSASSDIRFQCQEAGWNLETVQWAGPTNSLFHSTPSRNKGPGMERKMTRHTSAGCTLGSRCRNRRKGERSASSDFPVSLDQSGSQWREIGRAHV